MAYGLSYHAARVSLDDVIFGLHSLTKPVLLALALASCARPEPPVSAKTPSRLLGQLALDGLVRHGCETHRDRILPVDAAPGHSSVGRVWLRDCRAQRGDDSVALDVQLIGWQWVDARASGFDVREYVYFRASVSGRVAAVIDAESGEVELHVQSVDPPEVDVTEVGRVSARPASPVSALLGAAGSLFGYGANAMATDAMRSQVRDLVATRLRAGGSVRIDAALSSKAAATSWLQTKEELHPGGALIDGPFPAFSRARLQYDARGAVLARPVCLEEARIAIDAIVSGGSAPSNGVPPSVTTLDGKGGIDLAPMPCPWVLVTGLVDTRAEPSSEIALSLSAGSDTDTRNGSSRFMRATLIAFEITEPPRDPNEPPTKKPDLGFSLRVGTRVIPLGPILPSTREATVWLESAPFFARSREPIVLRIVDAHPKGPSLLSAKIVLDERLVGEATIDTARTTSPQGTRLTIEREGRAVGWATLRLVSAATP